MTIKKRWIEAVVETAKNNSTLMPWGRGARRQEMIENRKDDQPVKRTA
ncbi:MAG: hypothetical protein P8L32_02490 [Paracoccaceae bacterium]|jgi:hypothetical protein|nr:hypothetical protein [Paracoccaceae bacterium]